MHEWVVHIIYSSNSGCHIYLLAKFRDAKEAKIHRKGKEMATMGTEDGIWRHLLVQCKSLQSVGTVKPCGIYGG